MRRFEDAAWTAAKLGAALVGCLTLANCSSSSSTKTGSKVDPKYGVSASPRVVQPGEPVPKGGGVYRVGQPYVVEGRTYYPQENPRYRAEGTASWYGEAFHGRLTANGEVFDMELIAAAHPTMPLPSYARVTNLANRRSIIVRVNDRGPYHGGRVIDVSMRAAEALDFQRRGTSRVRVEYIGPAPMEGSDDRRLMATLREGAPAPSPSLVRVASTRPFVPAPERHASVVPRPRAEAERVPADREVVPPGEGWLRSRPDPADAVARAALPPPAGPSLAPSATAYAPGPSGYMGPQAVTSGRGLY